MLRNKKGSGVMVGTVVVIITVVILLFISLLVVSKVRASISTAYLNDDNSTTGWTAEDNQSFTDIKNNSSTAFSLMAISLIVLVAFLIISILRGG